MWLTNVENCDFECVKHPELIPSESTGREALEYGMAVLLMFTKDLQVMRMLPAASTNGHK